MKTGSRLAVAFLVLSLGAGSVACNKTLTDVGTSPDSIDRSAKATPSKLEPRLSRPPKPALFDHKSTVFIGR